MKKISILFLSFIALLFLSVYLAPSAYADIPSGDVAINLTVVEGEGPEGIVVDYPPIVAPFGNTLSLELSAIEAHTEKDFAFYIHNGQRIANSGASFLVSGSTHLVVVLKSPGEVVAAFVDTNGKLLDVQYNAGSFTPAYGGSTPTKPGYQFTGFGSVGNISNDAVFVARYNQTNEGPVAVTINGGTADPVEPIYNDVVTLTPGVGNFSYWADEDGQVVSTKADYAFTALQPIELTAVFDAASSNEPLIYLTNVTGIREDYQSFVGYVEYDAGDYTLVEYGLLASESSEVLDHDTDGVTVIPSTALAPTNEFLRSFETGEFTSFRAYAIFSDGEDQIVKYSDNNYAQANTLEFSFDFQTSTHPNNYGPSGEDYLSTYSYKNLVDDSDFEISFLRVAKNTAPTAGASSALVISPRQNQGGGEAYAEFDLGDYSIDALEFDIYYWNAAAEQHFQTFEVQNWNGSAWEQVFNLLPVLEGKLTIETVYFNFSTSRFRIYAGNGEANGNNARVQVDNLKLYTAAEAKFYGVKFINDELSQVLSIPKGNQIEDVIDTAREGFEFDGWFIDEAFSGSPFDLNTPINQHTTLYAKYTALPQFTITFNLHDGSGDGPYGNQAKYYGQTIDKPADPTRDGYDFEGWFVDEDIWEEEWNFDDVVEGNINLHAYWIEEDDGPSDPVYATDLFISRYVEGAPGNRKAIQIFNGTGETVTLTGVYSIRLGVNGATWSTTINLTGSIAHGGVFVLTYGPDGGWTANQTSGSLSYNGDDAVGLFKNGELLDVFGIVGEDPGTGWSLSAPGNGSDTVDKVVVRSDDTLSPSTSWIKSEWTVELSIPNATTDAAVGILLQSFDWNPE